MLCSHLTPQSVLGAAVLVPVGVQKGQEVNIQAVEEGGEGGVGVVQDVPQYPAHCGRADPLPSMDATVWGGENFRLSFIIIEDRRTEYL